MKLHRHSRQRSFRRHEDGAVAVEFALTAPILFLLIFGIVEYGMLMLATNMIENATSNASRLGKTGYTQAGVSRQDMIYNMIKNNATMLLDPTKVAIASKTYQKIENIGDPEPYTDSNHNGMYNAGESYTDVNGNGQWDSDMGAAGLGGAGDIVVYTVTYPWKVMTPFMGSVIGQSGTYTITSSVVVRNEPYDN